MEKTLKVRFLEAVRDALLLELAEQRKQDANVNQAAKEFNAAGLLRILGATNTDVLMNQGKGYTFITVKATDGGFYDDFRFSQRRAMTQAEYDSIGDLDLADVVAVAGFYVNPEGAMTTSFKWDKLITTDGREIKISGPVRKWHSDTEEYDAPIYEESDDADDAANDAK